MLDLQFVNTEEHAEAWKSKVSQWRDVVAVCGGSKVSSLLQHNPSTPAFNSRVCITLGPPHPTTAPSVHGVKGENPARRAWFPPLLSAVALTAFIEPKRGSIDERCLGSGQDNAAPTGDCCWKAGGDICLGCRNTIHYRSPTRSWRSTCTDSMSGRGRLTE